MHIWLTLLGGRYAAKFCKPLVDSKGRTSCSHISTLCDLEFLLRQMVRVSQAVLM